MDYTILEADLVGMMFTVAGHIDEEVSIHQEELRLQLKDSKDELAQDFERRGEQASSDLRREVDAATNQVKQQLDRHGQAISTELKKDIDVELRRKTDDARSSIDEHAKSCNENTKLQINTSTGL